jgi:hypothetical protein
MRLPTTYSPDQIFDFNVAKGTSPLNFGNGEPCVREHIGRIASEETIIWGALSGDELVGIITAECNGAYWNNSSESKDSTCFVNEFVVN